MFPAILLVALLGAPAADAPPGFTAIFDGASLDGWWGLDTVDPASWIGEDDAALAARRAASLADIRSHWSVEDGALVNDGDGLYLTTEALYGDFELRLEYRTVAGADSGVYLRGVPQVQIWDTTEAGGKWAIGADKGSGGLWNNAPDAPGRDPLVHADRPFGDWNALRITMVGERVTVFLNDRLVVDHARLENYFDRGRPIPRSGPIQLQTHGGEIRWRNLFVRGIGAAEANRILRAGGPHRVEAARDDGFAPIFNGRDLAGWQGAVESYEVRDGAVACLAGHGGVLFTEETYDDFEVRFEFNLPPGGNNGLAIRYPGTGDAAYAGMCELQILDDEHERYAALDPRQYHGSVYGQVAAHRGYLRPAGTWNEQVVTVRGSTIRVELNGTRILDADIDAVTDLMYDAGRFAGRGRRDGHFGFAGHDDRVRFRAIEIRRLAQ